MRTLEIHGRTENGKLLLNPYQQQQRQQWLNDMKQSDVIVIFAKGKKPKSSQQLGYIFAGIIETVKRTLDERGYDVGETGAPWTKEQIRYVLYVQHHIKKGGTTETLNAMKTLSKMEGDETSEFITSSLQWLAGNPWRIFVPLPQMPQTKLDK